MSRSLPSDKLHWESQSIDWLRFPLCLLVVFLHLHPQGIPFFKSETNGGEMFRIVVDVTTHVAQVAVPTFFFISGYYFFRLGQSWSWSSYASKLRKRSRTLLLPYLLWNVLPILITLLLLLITSPFSESIKYVNHITQRGWLSIFWNYWNRGGQVGPYVFPLWFMRDLMVVVIISPIIYVALKRLKFLFPLLLTVCLLSSFWIDVTGMSLIAFLFFSIGAYIRLSGSNIPDTFYRFRYVFWFLWPCVLFLRSWPGAPLPSLHYPLSILLGLGALVTLSLELNRRHWVNLYPTLANSAFFVYAAHTVIVMQHSFIGEALKVGEYLSSSNTLVSALIVYFLSPVICAVFCLLLYEILKRLLPSFFTLLTGNR